MILKNGSFADFSQRVKMAEKQIIVYGAGVIGQVSAPYWISQYQMEENVLCYVDTDIHKQGQMVQIGSRRIPIRPLTALDEESGRYVLLITVSAFEPVVRALERILGIKDAEVYFLPVMLLDIAHAPKEGGVIRTGDTPLIPKKIHYCWFGRNPIPSELQKCMDSWKKFCPDYEIVRWDESNYDVNKHEYMKQAYRHKKWGYIPDYARLDILYHYGGIYLDTDVELIWNLDELLYEPAFCSTEKWGVINMGISGAQSGNPVLERMLDARRTLPFLHPDGTENLLSSGVSDTLPLISLGFRPNGETQRIAGGEMSVYAPDFFQPFDYVSGVTHITDNTVSIHHFSGTWLGRNAALERKRTRQRFGEFMSQLEE